MASTLLVQSLTLTLLGLTVLSVEAFPMLTFGGLPAKCPKVNVAQQPLALYMYPHSPDGHGHNNNNGNHHGNGPFDPDYYSWSSLRASGRIYDGNNGDVNGNGNVDPNQRARERIRAQQLTNNANSQGQQQPRSPMSPNVPISVNEPGAFANPLADVTNGSNNYADIAQQPYYKSDNEQLQSGNSAPAASDSSRGGRSSTRSSNSDQGRSRRVPYSAVDSYEGMNAQTFTNIDFDAPLHRRQAVGNVVRSPAPYSSSAAAGSSSTEPTRRARVAYDPVNDNSGRYKLHHDIVVDDECYLGKDMMSPDCVDFDPPHKTRVVSSSSSSSGAAPSYSRAGTSTGLNMNRQNNGNGSASSSSSAASSPSPYNRNNMNIRANSSSSSNDNDAQYVPSSSPVPYSPPPQPVPTGGPVPYSGLNNPLNANSIFGNANRYMQYDNNGNNGNSNSNLNGGNGDVSVAEPYRPPPQQQQQQQVRPQLNTPEPPQQGWESAPDDNWTTRGQARSRPQQQQQQVMEQQLEQQLEQQQEQPLQVQEEQQPLIMTQAQSDAASKAAVYAFCESLFETADNLSRAMASVPIELRQKNRAGAAKSDSSTDPKNAELANLFAGIQMADDALLKALKQQGLERCGSIGDEFDPNFHQALYQVEDSSNTLEAGSIAQIIKVGFTLDNKVVRVAEVGVVKERAEEEDEEDDEDSESESESEKKANEITAKIEAAKAERNQKAKKDTTDNEQEANKEKRKPEEEQGKKEEVPKLEQK
jgi:molecular chaperone GrpE